VKASKVYENGTTVSTKHRLHISFVSVRFILRLVKSSIHLLHLVLDPNVKDLYCRHRWEQEQYDRGISCLEAVVRAVLYNVSYLKTKFHPFKFDEYYVAQNSETGHITATSAVDGDSRHSRIYIHVTNTYLIESVINAMPTRRYGCSYLLEAVQSFEKEKKAGNPRDELTMYLEAGIEVVSDVISWWGVGTTHMACRKPSYFILSIRQNRNIQPLNALPVIISQSRVLRRPRNVPLALEALQDPIDVAA
jgi:hypothetical protein